MPVTINAITPTVGLEIIGMTADQLVEPQTAAEAQHALDEHGVVVYREVNISDEQLLAFSRLLGKLVVHQPASTTTRKSKPSLWIRPRRTHCWPHTGREISTGTSTARLTNTRKKQHFSRRAQ